MPVAPHAHFVDHLTVIVYNDRLIVNEVMAAESVQDQRMLIAAAALGTVFEWYDFFLYGSLAVLFGHLFFPPDNDTAALLASLATFGVGFVMRPLGALVFGILGDRIGRQRTFAITIVMMGLSTVGIGALPTYERVGTLAPVLLLLMRMVQGFSVGGEYGSAAAYVAEHAAPSRRGYATGWIQASATVGLLLCLLVVLACRISMSDAQFQDWGWRIPFLTSILLLLVSIYVRLQLQESPVFQRLQLGGQTSTAPLRESFGSWNNLSRVLIALFGITTGMTVIWYTAQFYALFFLQATLQVDYKTSYAIFAAGLALGTPLIVLCGAWSDRVGRKPIMLAGLLLGGVTLIPSFHALADYANPALIDFSTRNPIVIRANNCTRSLFSAPVTECDQAKHFFAGKGLRTRWIHALQATPLLRRLATGR